MHGPAALTVAQYPIARKPAFGGEFSVLISPLPALEVGTLEITAANTGTWTPDPVNTTLAHDLIAVCENPLDGTDTNVVLTITGTDTSDAALTATATFKPIAWAQNSSRLFMPGYSVDCVPSAAELFKTITSVTVACAVGAKTSRITLFAMPATATFKLVGCTTDKDFSTKSRNSKPIACGMDGSAFSKPGRSDPGELTIKSKLITFGDGLMRYDSVDCTVMAKLVKQGQIHTDTAYFIGFNGKVKPSAPDGDGEAMLDSQGFYEDIALMVAAGAT